VLAKPAAKHALAAPAKKPATATQSAAGKPKALPNKPAGKDGEEWEEWEEF
jgi:hypothetical protein